jgi:hypothetical protein
MTVWSKLRLNSKLVWAAIIPWQNWQNATGLGSKTHGEWWKYVADQLGRQSSLHPPTGHEPAFGLSSRVAGGVIRDGTSRKHEEHWQSTCGQRQAKGFPGRFLLKELENYWMWAETGWDIDRAADRALMFKWTSVFRLGPVDGPVCGSCRQAFQMALHVLCDWGIDCIRYLGRHFLTTVDFGDIPVTKVPNFVRSVGLLNEWAEWPLKRSNTVDVHASLWCPPSRSLFSSVQSVTHIPSTLWLMIIRDSLNWSLNCPIDEFCTTFVFQLTYQIRHTARYCLQKRNRKRSSMQ